MRDADRQELEGRINEARVRENRFERRHENQLQHRNAVGEDEEDDELRDRRVLGFEVLPPPGKSLHECSFTSVESGEAGAASSGLVEFALGGLIRAGVGDKADGCSGEAPQGVSVHCEEDRVHHVRACHTVAHLRDSSEWHVEDEEDVEVRGFPSRPPSL